MEFRKVNDNEEDIGEVNDLENNTADDDRILVMVKNCFDNNDDDDDDDDDDDIGGIGVGVSRPRANHTHCGRSGCTIACDYSGSTIVPLWLWREHFKP